MPPKDSTQKPDADPVVLAAPTGTAVPIDATAFASPPMAITIAGAPVTRGLVADEFAGTGGSFIVRRGATQRERVVAPADQLDPARDPAAAVRRLDPPDDTAA